VPAQPEELSMEIPKLLEDTPRPAVRLERARVPSVVTTVADRHAPIHHAAALASAADLAVADLAVAEAADLAVVAAAGIANRSLIMGVFDHKS
jgi:hypothetical protein